MSNNVYHHSATSADCRHGGTKFVVECRVARLTATAFCRRGSRQDRRRIKRRGGRYMSRPHSHWHVMPEIFPRPPISKTHSPLFSLETNQISISQSPSLPRRMPRPLMRPYLTRQSRHASSRKSPARKPPPFGRQKLRPLRIKTRRCFGRLFRPSVHCHSSALRALHSCATFSPMRLPIPSHAHSTARKTISTWRLHYLFKIRILQKPPWMHQGVLSEGKRLRPTSNFMSVPAHGARLVQSRPAGSVPTLRPAAAKAAAPTGTASTLKISNMSHVQATTRRLLALLLIMMNMMMSRWRKHCRPRRRQITPCTPRSMHSRRRGGRAPRFHFRLRRRRNLAQHLVQSAPRTLQIELRALSLHIKTRNRQR